MRAVYIAIALLVCTAVPNPAQTGSALDRWVPFTVATVPFGVGERLDYRVTYGLLGTVGQSSLVISSIDTLRGAPAYHIDFRLKGAVTFAKVDDHFQSWLDVERLHSHRFDQNQQEVNYKRHRVLDFLPAERIWKRLDNDETGPLATEQPLDEISFLYYVRTLPLVVGETYTLDLYYKESGNPVVVKVLRTEKIKVPAGEFETLVVQPLINTSKMFSEGGKAEVYFTNDERRLIVQLKTKFSIGTLNLQLRSYTPGTRLTTVPGMQTESQP
jgi:hypothetical protein